MSAKKVKPSDSLVKWVIADVLAESAVTFLKVMVVQIALANGSKVHAALALAAVHYICTSTWGINMHIFTDPIMSAVLFAVNAIWGGNTASTETVRTAGNAWSFALRMVANITLSALGGFMFSKLAGGLLSTAYIPQNVIPGYDQSWAIATTFFVVLIGYHIVLFLLNFQSDGFGSSLAVGATYGAITLATSAILNVYLDISVNVAIAVAARDYSGLSVTSLLVMLGAGVATVVFYWLIWDMFFSAEVMREKKAKNVLNDINGSYHNDDLETNGNLNVPAKHRHRQANDAINGY